MTLAFSWLVKYFSKVKMENKMYLEMSHETEKNSRNYVGKSTSSKKKRIEETVITKIVKSFHWSSESNWKIYLKWLPVLSKKCWVPICQDGLSQIQCKYLYSVCEKRLFRVYKIPVFDAVQCNVSAQSAGKIFIKKTELDSWKRKMATKVSAKYK